MLLLTIACCATGLALSSAVIRAGRAAGWL
jgi:hypothetical protein